MPTPEEFEPRDFLPYLLNQAAEQTSLGFQRLYKNRYGMLRTEWRVLFHLGRHGAMTASEISASGRIHKTKISRAVSALEGRRFLKRRALEHDRRQEQLTLTQAGVRAYQDLAAEAQAYDRTLTARFTPDEQALLRICLRRLAGF
jgi:DNA-binding MarR family transcriptional regulator